MIYIGKSESGEATEIMKIYKFYEYFTDIYFKKALSNYFYEINFDLKKFDLNYFLSTCDVYEEEICDLKICVLEAFKNIETENYGFVDEKNALLKIPYKEPRNAEKASILEKNICCAFYFVLEEKSHGNQWSLMTRNEAEFFQKNNFVELFASPFNSRCGLYCSLLPCDIPFKSLGDNRIFLQRILSGEIYYRNLYFSPPSGIETQKKVVKTILSLLNMNKIFHIVCVLSNNKKYKSTFELRRSAFCRREKNASFCFDFSTGKRINMTSRPWTWFYLTNANPLKFLCN